MHRCRLVSMLANIVISCMLISYKHDRFTKSKNLKLKQSKPITHYVSHILCQIKQALK